MRRVDRRTNALPTNRPTDAPKKRLILIHTVLLGEIASRISYDVVQEFEQGRFLKPPQYDLDGSSGGRKTFRKKIPLRKIRPTSIAPQMRMS